MKAKRKTFRNFAWVVQWWTTKTTCISILLPLLLLSCILSIPFVFVLFCSPTVFFQKRQILPPHPPCSPYNVPYKNNSCYHRSFLDRPFFKGPVGRFQSNNQTAYSSLGEWAMACVMDMGSSCSTLACFLWWCFFFLCSIACPSLTSWSWAFWMTLS